MKKITLMATFFAAFAMNAQTTIWEEGFESYPDFELTTNGVVGDWTETDLDASPTYGSSSFDFTNESYTGTAIIFNATTMTDADPADPQDRTIWQARTGDKGLYMFAATSLLNDDYIISPAIDLSSVTAPQFSFWAKSVTDAFGLERFNVLLSTTTNDWFNFTEDLAGSEQQAPLDYTEYSYDLSAYEGQVVYVAIHYVAQDSFVLQMDDFKVEGGTLGFDSNTFNNFNYFVNANNQLNLSAKTAMESVELYNVLGQQVVSQKLNNTNEVVNISALNTGLYIATVSIDGNTKSFKIVKK
jgi:hypothetical protein